jgi:hypothetical protein
MDRHDSREGDFSGSIKEDCIFTQSVIDAIVVHRPKHENNSFLKYSGGVGGAHSSATVCATRKQVIDTIVARAKTCLICGICDAAVTQECDPPI